MKLIIKFVVRTKLKSMSREAAAKLAFNNGQKYLDLAKGLSAEQGEKVVSVPAGVGVDHDMTDWSFYQLLEHNTIVNQQMTKLTVALALGEDLSRFDSFNPKTDVLPSPNAGAEWVRLFEESIQKHNDSVKPLEDLKNTAVRKHPLFGDFNAHMWNGMLGFHLGIHIKQATRITAGV